MITGSGGLFLNGSWLAFCFADMKEQIRRHAVGEGYGRSEQVIQDLLAETSDHALIPLEAGGAEAAADLGNIRSGETCPVREH